jgi:hypothetical protein
VAATVQLRRDRRRDPIAERQGVDRALETFAATLDGPASERPRMGPVSSSSHRARGRSRAWADERGEPGAHARILAPRRLLMPRACPRPSRLWRPIRCPRVSPSLCSRPFVALAVAYRQRTRSRISRPLSRSE